MKTVIRFLEIIILVFILTGCDTVADSETLESNDYYFKTLSFERSGSIVYDTRTGVEYWLPDPTTYNTGSLTLLVDKDGKPLIYKGE